MDSGGLGNFRINRYAGTNETTAFHEVRMDDYDEEIGSGGGGIGGAPSFGRNLSTCFGGRGLNARPKIGAGRGYVSSNLTGPDDGYFTAGDNDAGPGFGTPVGLGNTRGFQTQRPMSSGYFSAGHNASPFGGGSTGLLGRGPPGRAGGYDDNGGFSNTGRIGGARISGGSGFGMGNVTTLQRSFFNVKQYGQEYSSKPHQPQRYDDQDRQDEDMEPPPRHHNVTYSSMETMGPVFRRGGLRGAGRINQVSRSISGGGGAGGRFSRKPGEDRGPRDQSQSNTRRSEPLLPTPSAPRSNSSIMSVSPKRTPRFTNPSKSVPAKVGVHLDITPPIFKEMSNRGLGDKVFIMIPKQAKTVMDVKIHVANMLGVEVFLVNFFIDGFRIPENEDVEAFACISANSLVQVVKPGYRPPCDLSKFNKTGGDKSDQAPATNVEECESQASSAKKKNATPIESETVELEHEEAGLPERKRRPDYMEPSLLEPSSRRCRYSNTAQAGASNNVTTLTPITKHVGTPNSSPKKVVIEIVLSDDDDDVGVVKQDQFQDIPENKNMDKSAKGEVPSSSSSPGDLVIAEANESKGKGEAKTNAEASASKNQSQSDGQYPEFTVEDEVGNDSPSANSAPGTSQGHQGTEGTTTAAECVAVKSNTQDVQPQSRNNCDQNTQPQQSDGSSENWLNASGQVVGRGHKRRTHDVTEVVDLSSQEEDNNEDDDDGSSTTFEEESNETFFTIKAVQSIPVAVFKSIEEESQKQAANALRECQSLSQENWDITSANPSDSVQTLAPVTVPRSALRNPFANQFPNNSERTDLQVESNVPSNSTDISEAATVDSTSTPGSEVGTVAANISPPTEKIEKKATPIDEVNQIKCGSLILYQVMEKVETQGQGENPEGSAEDGERQLSDVKCCKVIGRCGLKLTLEPVDQACASTESTSMETDGSDLPPKRFVFVDFKDMINLQELVQE